jgi:hypothetical protein
VKVTLTIDTSRKDFSSKWEDVRYLLYDVLEDMSQMIFKNDEVDVSGQPKHFISYGKDMCKLEVTLEHKTKS